MFTIPEDKQKEQGGYTSHYNGKACKYTSTRPFGLHAYGDGDGSDATPLYPKTMFSKNFAASVDYEFMAFVSNGAGTITVRDGTIVTKITLVCGSGGVCKGRHGVSGKRGTLISSTVPVWAMVECSRSNDEQVLYGDFDAGIAGTYALTHVSVIPFRVKLDRWSP